MDKMFFRIKKTLKKWLMLLNFCKTLTKVKLHQYRKLWKQKLKIVIYLLLSY